MKRTIWAGVLSCLLAAILVFGNRTVKQNCNLLLEQVDGCKAEKNKASAIKMAEALEDEWIQKEGLLSVFINRNIVQEIGVSVALIKQYASKPDSMEYTAYCTQTQVLITHAVKNQRLSF